MEISAVDSVSRALASGVDHTLGPREAGPSFSDLLGGMIERAEDDSRRAITLSESLAKGEPQDLHRVMTALNEADVSFRMVLEVRNKLVEAWQEIKRMPI